MRMHTAGFTQHYSVEIFRCAKRIRHCSAGFTLLEMIAALGVFSVIIIIFSSTFLNLLNAERKAQIASSVQDNLRFAIEVMSKEIRTGTQYQVPPQPTNTAITFVNANDESITYRVSGPDIANNPCSDEKPCIVKSVNGGDFLPLTSDQIAIDDLLFFVGGIQPRIQIIIRARATVQNVETQLNLQTTVSQRNIVRPTP
ncbi:MAG: prepilin-type N-terminal cleavage/methylation domain-containing protein [Candidatus Niyogibacteria bacterium]|nr:prepilin-type N-terminal cleavage/methylation domain-containing protein [Candidatus Niyogibacteria bacterium]